MKLIVGLGNPGKQYEKTRHNVGFLLLDEFLHLHKGVKWELSKKFNAEIAEITEDGQKILLLKPMTFMNQSGESVGLVSHYYKISPKDILVIHDDKDILLGELKVQTDRGHAGHNGVRSLIEHLNTQEFKRIRIGVKSENEKKMVDTAKFVLGKFGILEKRKLNLIFENVLKEIQSFLKT